MRKVANGRVGFFGSIAFKIMLLVLVSVFISSVITVISIVPNVAAHLTKSTENSMLDLVDSYGKIIKLSESTKEMNYEDYAEILNGVGIKGVKSAYIYLVDSTGIMLYHPTSEKVGNAVENEVVKGLVNQLQGGEKPANATVEYNFKGAIKYAAYDILENNDILVLTADEDDVHASIRNTTLRAYAIILMLVILFVAIAYFASKIVTKPLQMLTEVIDRTADFDFASKGKTHKLINHKDETGVMAKAINDMRIRLREMIYSLEETSENINDNVEKLTIVSNDINSRCMDNSATTEELAAGMQETAATTETISASIEGMQSNAEGIDRMTKGGEETSNIILERAEQLKRTTEQATRRTTDMYNGVKKKTEKAIEDSKAVEKINELTNVIMDVSSQTSLLALNASIEAARAGESGRGFAVVATEIGKLANQTSRTVEDITLIVNEVNGAVTNLTESLNDMIEFLEKTVQNDFFSFAEVSTQYSEDANTFKNSMNQIGDATHELIISISEISDSLIGINTTVGESSAGVTDIAEKTSEVVTKTTNNFEIVNKCKESVEKLQKIAEQFTLD